MMSSVAQWEEFPQDSTRSLEYVKNLLSRRLVVLLGDPAQPSPFTRPQSKRGRRPGSGAFPDKVSLLRVLLPIFRLVKECNDGGVPSMKECVEYDQYRPNDNGEVVIVGISVRQLRRLRVKWGIPWPPE